MNRGRCIRRETAGWCEEEDRKKSKEELEVNDDADDENALPQSAVSADSSAQFKSQLISQVAP